MPDRLTKLQSLLINRVAFVPSGDNPEAQIALWKADPALEWAETVLKRTFTKAQRIALAKSGAAIPVKNADGEIIDGRYPIENKVDLKNAMQAIGRVAEGDREQVIRHIRKRARALGATDMLSDTFKEDGTMPETDVEKAPRLTEARRTVLREIRDKLGEVLGDKEGEGGSMSDTDKEFTLPDDSPEEVRKAFADLKAERDGALDAAAKAKVEAEEAAKKTEPEPDEDQDPIAKALADPDVPEAVKAVLKAEHDRATAAEQTSKDTAEKLAKAEADRADEAAIAKARELDKLTLDAEKLGPALRKFAESDPESASEIERVLRAANATAREAFVEIGKGGPEEGSAEAKLDKMAADIAAEKNISKAEGYAAAVETEEGRRLRKEVQAEAREGV